MIQLWARTFVFLVVQGEPEEALGGPLGSPYDCSAGRRLAGSCIESPSPSLGGSAGWRCGTGGASSPPARGGFKPIFSSLPILAGIPTPQSEGS